MQDLSSASLSVGLYISPEKKKKKKGKQINNNKKNLNPHTHESTKPHSIISQDTARP